MAKKSKRQRKLLAEKELKRAAGLAKAGEPYSKHKVRVCCHYSVIGGMMVGVFARSYLMQFTDNTYQCLECGKTFTAEQAEKIEKLCHYFEMAPIKSYSAARELLTEDILPVKYYYILR